MTDPQTIVEQQVAQTVNVYQQAGLNPIAVVIAMLDADGKAHIDGASNHDYPSAALFQQELSELLAAVYAPDRKSAVQEIEARVVAKIAAALEAAQHDPERAWCKVRLERDGAHIDLDYEAAARIACTEPR